MKAHQEKKTARTDPPTVSRSGVDYAANAKLRSETYAAIARCRTLRTAK